MNKTNSKNIVISTLVKCGKINFLISIFKIKVFTPATRYSNIDIINVNGYCLACKLKRVQIFTIFMKNLECSIEKKAKLDINPKIIVFIEYNNLFDIYSKKDLNILLYIKSIIIKLY